MAFIIIVGLITGLIISIYNNKELKNENERLIKQVKKLSESRNELLKMNGLTLQDIQNKTSNANEAKNENAKNENVKNESIKEVTKETRQHHTERNVSSQKPKKSEEETKNNFILMTGAFLIVLAAIVFLTSMWDIISDVFKVGVLSLLAVVFLGMSKIANDKFKLPNTANTFFYIAMAYIPVLSLAIYLINITSGYLQTSQQQNVFWLIACLIMGVIYGIISFKSNRNLLFVGSLIMQVLAVIFGTLIYTDWIENILIAIGIYNLILTFVNLFVKKKKFSDIIKNFNNVLFGILVCVTFLSAIIAGLCIEATVSLVLATLIQIITAILFIIKTKEIGYLFVPVLGTFLTVLEIINLENTFYLAYITKQIIMLITTLVLFAIGMFSKWNNLRAVTKFTTYTFLGMICCSTFGVEGIDTYIVLFISSAVSLTFMWLDSEYKYEYLHTAIILGLLGSIFLITDFTEYAIFEYMMLIISIALYIISMFVEEKAAKIVKLYTNITTSISMLILSFDISLIKVALNIVSLAMFNINIKKMQASEYLNLVPLILLIPSIYMSNLFADKPYIMQVLSIIIITYFTFLSIKDKRFNVYSIATYSYWMMQVVSLDVNKYVNTILFGLITALQVLSYKENAKNVLKIGFYLTVLTLYNMIMTDLNVEMVSIISIGYLAVLGLITRNSIYKSNPTLCKNVEYIGFALIYLWGISSYVSSLDALLFMGLLVGIIIFTYSKKYGPIFLCSVLAEILMAFNVTKEFWASIPWWIYLLVGGAILISFAVRNEAREKEGKKGIKNKFKELSNKLDM